MSTSRDTFDTFETFASEQLATVTGGCGGSDHSSGGSNFGDIRQLQQSLAKLGFNPGRIDGINGPNTRRAIRAFQAQASIGVDGIVGKHTRRALLAALGR
jgi:peptidoglycan hydrolase-like protein with peptidoglycan-binding domain